MDDPTAERHGSIARALVTLPVSAAAALLLGTPARPELPIGATDGAVLVDFARDGLRLVLTVGLWYLAVVALLVLLSRIPGRGRQFAGLVHRVTAVGIGVVVRRVLVTSAVTATASPVAAGAQTADQPPTTTTPELVMPEDEPPVMTPIDPDSPVAPRPSSDTGPSVGPGRSDQPGATDGRDTRAGRDLSVREGRDEHRPTTDVTSTDSTTDGRPEMTRRSGERAEASSTDRAPNMRRIDPPARPSSVRSGHAGDDLPRPHEPARPRARHHVQAGESFWSIAVELTASADRPAPDPAQVLPTWQRLLDQNADVLVDPGNPDLLHVGQVIDTRLGD